MRKPVLILAILCLILLISNSIFGYLLIDRSITLSYVRASQTGTARSLSILQSTLLHKWKGKSKKEITKEIQEISENSKALPIVIKDEGDTIWLDDVPLEFSEDQLVKIGDKETSSR
ncbi:hypothetical protein C8232_10205 [Paracidovorax avenae]|nr:hypothetical protein C8232_10205 [Paracidovorax avenae]